MVGRNEVVVLGSVSVGNHGFFCIGGLLSGYASKMSTKDFLAFLCAFHISLNIILTQRLFFCIIMSDGLENMPLVITERKQ